MPTLRDPRRLAQALGTRIRELVAALPDGSQCEGVGVPGMVDAATGRVLHAPTLGWRNVDLRDRLSAAAGLPVQIENSACACARAQMWQTRHVRPPCEIWCS